MTRSVSAYVAAVEDDLRAVLTGRGECLPSKERTTLLYQMMQYHMGWLDPTLSPDEAIASASGRGGRTGKRLRPLLCLLACEGVGGDWQRALPAASAIELIHNFSLLHDDIEDNSPTRRHRPTVWSLWGIPQGINTGDTMWVISRLSTWRLVDRGYDAALVLRVARLLDETCLRLCEGQYLDISFETQDIVSLGDYQEMIEGKTAALLSASLAVGALLGGANDQSVRHCASFGRELGLTFQIVDDMLGIWGNPAVTGKSAASDILEKKKTMPILHALQWEQSQGYTDLLRLYSGPALGVQDIPAVLALLSRSGAQDAARLAAHDHQERTLAHLDAAGLGHPAHDDLRELALSLVGRTS